MSFKVDHARMGREGFEISIGVGKVFRARNIQEVIYGMEHYFLTNAPGYSGDNTQNFSMSKHREHQKECPCCPLCRGKGGD